MKQIMEALGKAVQALLSAKTLWFLIVAAAGAAMFLLVYYKTGWPFGGGECTAKANDFLGLCSWLSNYRTEIGQTAVVTIFLLLTGLLFQLWAVLRSANPAPAPPQQPGTDAKVVTKQ